MADFLTAIYLDQVEDASIGLGSLGPGLGAVELDMTVLVRHEDAGFGLGSAQPGSVGALIAGGAISSVSDDAINTFESSTGELAEQLVDAGISQEMLVTLATEALRHDAVVLVVAGEELTQEVLPAEQEMRSWRLDSKAVQGLSAYQSPLGEPVLPPRETYVCPYCDFRFTSWGIGVPVPDCCPYHHVALERE